MEINKILWASDGSMESDMALKYVELLASKYGSEIVGLSVVQPVDIERLKVPVDVKKELFSIQALLEKKEYNRINKALKQLELKATKLDVCIETGIPHKEILRVAKEEKVDLIAMGKRGLGLKDRILLGSNTNKVLRMANAPVLAVRHKKGDKIDIKKILVPTDLSELTSISLDFAIDIANRFNSTIYLLHTLELHHSYEISTSKIIEELRVLALKELRSYLNKIPKEKTKGINIQEMVTLYLRAWFGIVNFAEENGIDLIIMTTHGRKGLVRFMLGSTAEKVISESPCPVLTIKP
ncbi:MAG: putative universal stress protein [Candidatus Dadabacteria bacterium CSP1-2]|nr:MAG: putative universal stress protein [Candidatus Dadabacteria bacterium CSP1-2]